MRGNRWVWRAAIVHKIALRGQSIIVAGCPASRNGLRPGAKRAIIDNDCRRSDRYTVISPSGRGDGVDDPKSDGVCAIGYGSAIPGKAERRSGEVTTNRHIVYQDLDRHRAHRVTARIIYAEPDRTADNKDISEIA